MKEKLLTNFKAEYIFLILLLGVLFMPKYSFGSSSLAPFILQDTETETQLKTTDSIQEFRRLAKVYADSLNAEQAITYAKRYIRATSDLSIINDHYFSNIEHTNLYLNFKANYKPQFNFLSIFYLFAGFIGLFIFVVLNLKRGVNKQSTFLISLFVLFHSLFIIHLSLYLINCHYYFPDSLLVSTVFTLLYGPLIYLYFRMTVTNYRLRWLDGIHFLPAIVLLIYIFPFYLLSSQEKFVILFDQEDILLSEANLIIAAKIISLLLYAVLTYRIYRQSIKDAEERSNMLLWQRNIIAIYFIYVLTFLIFSTITSGFISTLPVFHIQILVMVGIVFYVAYITYVQPEIFKGEVKLVDPINIFKYKKSGLTESFSDELKQHLLQLLNEEKIYKNNEMSLELLSEKLGTSRHNTSQVINAHFDMNFFELINKYRIDEAVNMINQDKLNELNIIDIAYEVGYNNKVTFNKSFKKIHAITPSQYIKSLRS
ncbi:MAG: AraC family transcriptional regulator [Bacteroidia bacterium]|nr:AraC family transcriptional regulator [Bacteroidia bacterium]NND52424.1 helix-turn-helix domain-containing protein [Flavobacteriaceae bacterium]